jgi:hypothetical protein
MQKRGLTSLIFMLGADISEFQTELRKSTREMQKWGKDIQKTGKSLSTYVTAPIVAMGTASVIAFRSLNESMKQVEAGIASTGGAAGYTADELKQMADEMGRLTSTLNQDILQGVTAQLLTFTNITGEAFKDAQMAALDLSARMGTDLRSSAMMVGRALNDPVLGLTALTRAGVQFTDQQRDAVRAMVETGNIAGAQRIILEELETQFGGSAEAAGDAFSDIKNSAIMLGQEFGELIYNAVTPLVESITSVIQRISDMDDRWKGIVLTLGAVVAAIGPVMVAIGYMATTVIPSAIKGVNTLIRAFRALRVAMLANPYMAIAAGVAAIGAAFWIMRNNINHAEKALRDVESAASQSISKQKVEMKMLMQVAKDQNRSDRERARALKEINSLMPDHIDDLDLATINTEKATEAQEAYIESLMKEARVVAAKERLVEIEHERQKALLEGASIQNQVTAGIRAGFNQVVRFQTQVGAVSNAAVVQGNKQIEIWEKQEEALLSIINGTNNYADAIKNLNDNTNDGSDADGERTGILKQLNDEIKELRDLEQQATTPQQIADIRDLIIEKEKEVEAVEKQIEAYQLLNQVLAGSPTRMPSIQPGRDPIETKKPTPIDEEAFDVLRQYRQALQEAATANEVFGESFNLLGAEIDITNWAINRFIDLGIDAESEMMQYLIEKLTELEGQLDGTKGSFSDFANVIESGMQNAVASFASGIGDMISGAGTLQGAFSGVMDSLATTLEDLGKLAIGAGISIEAIRESLTKLTGIGAIAAGVALIALAAVVKSSTSSIANKFGGGGAVGMAEGGVVPPGYPNDNYPARLTSGEIVVPPKKLERFFESITHSIVRTIQGGSSNMPSDSTINVSYIMPEAHQPASMMQFIDQIINPADITAPDHFTQFIDQVINPADITAPDHFTQLIDQVINPADITAPDHFTQFIDQIINPADITAPDHFTQFIDQVINPAANTSTSEIFQVVRQVTQLEGDDVDGVHKYIIKRMQNIPRMAMGGVVPPGYPNDTYPAFLSSGEKVVPDPMPLPEQHQQKSGEMIARIEGAGNDLVVYLKERERQMENSY